MAHEPKFEKTAVQVIPNTPPVEGLIIPVEESTERWSDITLSDGAQLRVKPVIISVVRIDSMRDPEGHPVYIVKAAPVVGIAKAATDQP